MPKFNQKEIQLFNQTLENAEEVPHSSFARFFLLKDSHVAAYHVLNENDEIRIKDQPIKKFKFLVSSETIGVEITFTNGKKNFYLSLFLIELLVKFGKSPFSEGIMLQAEEKRKWEKSSIASIYDSQTYAAYDRSAKLTAMILEEATFKNKTINLISIACGNSSGLMPIVRALKPKFTLQIGGFDINQVNIRCSQHFFPEGIFIVGDVNLTREHIKTIKSKFPSKEAETVLIFSGILANGVLDHVSSLRALQGAMDLGDKIVINSYSAGLITHQVAKAIGLQRLVAKMPPEGRPHSLTLYTAQTFEQRVANIITRSKKRSSEGKDNNLDLSMSADPERDINLLLRALAQFTPWDLAQHAVGETILPTFLDLNNIEQLDLSWCRITDEQISQIAKQIEESLPKLSRIVVAKTDPWFASLKSALNKSYQFYYRNDVPHESSIPVLSIAAARRFGLYTKPLLILNEPKPECSLPRLSSKGT